MAKRRQPGKLLRISEIYKGEIKQFSSGPLFFINGDEVPKVRVYGIILNKQMSSQNAEKKFCYLTIDDSSDTIRIKVWDSIYSTELFSIIENTKIGDLVDVLGKVREYEGEIYIYPDSITSYDDMDFELHRRAQLIESELEFKDLLTEEQLDLAPLEQHTSETEPQDESLDSIASSIKVSEPESEPQTDEEAEDDINQLIITAMSSDPTQNSVSNLAKKIKRSEDEVETALKMLSVDATEYNLVILQPNPGYYEKMEL
jgi:RPA family protein